MQNLSPLPHQMRPKNYTEFLGIDEILKRNPVLSKGNVPGFILYGPPGSGKTTLAKLWSEKSGHDFQELNAVHAGVAEVKKIIGQAEELKKTIFANQKKICLFIDEIHRFNKAQQDALLPSVERGLIILIGATTENPRAVLNQALLSRINLVKLSPLSKEQIEEILNRAIIKHTGKKILETEMAWLSSKVNGDARLALNTLEIIFNHLEISSNELDSKTWQEIKNQVLTHSRRFDKDGERHYDCISAFIKSLRGSDPDAALYWLALMLDGGEDPVFIARRLIIFSSEDVGNADPRALPLACAALTAVEKVGMPEAEICLSQATTYLASTVKSNASYLAIKEAKKYIQENPASTCPSHLKNTPNANYKYPHDYPNALVKQKYTTEDIPNFYRPKDYGQEKFLKSRLLDIQNLS